MEWIGVPETQEIVLRLEDQPPAKIVLNHPPSVYQKGRVNYPSRSTWERLPQGAFEEWKFETGPIRCLIVWIDNAGHKWSAVYWR